MANAVRWAVANGNWSNPATWNNGGVLGIPDSDGTDSVYTNGFTVNVDQNINVALLSNAARARDIATPQMTANNAPSPFSVVASNEGNGLAWRAFDRNTGLQWQNASPTGWIYYDFSNPTVIDGYYFLANNSTNTPRNWTFEGSNDAINWVVLHTVTNGAGVQSYSIGTIGNSTAYRFYRLNVSLNGGGTTVLIFELELYRPNTAAIAAGGSFSFNTGGVTANVTSITNGATNLFTITANSGLVTLSVSNNIVSSIVGGTMFNLSGNCNLTVNGTNFTAGFNGAVIFTKTGTGDLTINGNLVGGSGNSNPSNSFALNVSTGNVFIVGNISSIATSNNSNLHCINATGNCNIYITGNVFGSSVSTTGHGIVFTSTGLLSVNGDVVGGATANAIFNPSSSIIVKNVIAGVLPAITATTAISVTVNGDIYASALANAINLTTGTVILNGNMYNTLGRNAIWSPNLFISNSSTTKWVMDVGGGATKTLYSADTFPNLPSPSDVEDGILYGPSSSLLGIMKVPIPADVRRNVPVGNTVGTFTAMSAQDIINYISSSSDDLAKRLREILTIDQTNNIV